MKVETKEVHEVREADFSFGKIVEGTQGDVIRIFTPEINVLIRKNKVFVRWRVHRPNHDHNNRPSLTLELPEAGREVEGGARSIIHLDPDGFMPRFHIHSYEVREIDLWQAYNAAKRDGE